MIPLASFEVFLVFAVGCAVMIVFGLRGVLGLFAVLFFDDCGCCLDISILPGVRFGLCI